MAEAETHSPPRPPLVFTYTELSADFRRDPHALLDEQRAQRPAEHDAFLPAVLITSHALIRETLLDPSLSRDFSDATENPVLGSVKRLNDAVEREFGPHASIVTLDNVEHARVRGVVAEVFLRRAAASQPLITAAIDRALAGLDGKTKFDVIEDYAAHIPIRVLGGILGCGDADYAQLRAWTEAGQQAFDPTLSAEREQRAIDGRRGILSFFKELMAERRAFPKDDLISDLYAARDSGAPIAEHEILHNLFALLVAGHLTTSDLIGNGVHLLLDHPDQREKLLAHPDLIASAVEEILRYESPISFTARFSKQDGAVGGCPYKKGDGLTVNVLAANRDPERFEQPHRFDIERKPNHHLAFGAGAHICIGAPLARLEGQQAILRLFEKFPQLRRVTTDAPEWRATIGVRGLAKLEVLAK